MKPLFPFHPLGKPPWPPQALARDSVDVVAVEGASVLADIAIHPTERLVRRLSDPAVHSKVRVPVRYTRYESWKVTLDRVTALLLLILALPVILAAGFLVTLTSHGPMFYSQVRLGRHGRRFWILKIRTMRHDCEQHGGAR